MIREFAFGTVMASGPSDMRAYLCLVASVASIVVACGSDNDSTTNNSTPATTTPVNTTDPTTPASTSGTTSTAETADAGSGSTPLPATTGTVATPPPPDDVNMTNGTTMYGGNQRNWLLGTPRDYDASKAYPLVMLFHGNPGSKEQMRALIPFESVSSTNAILVYPDALDGAWDLYTPTDTNNDLNFIHALPGILAQTGLNIDTTKIYGFGFSGGSFFLTQFTCVFNDLFRAVAINSGGGPVEQQMNYPQRADGCYICPVGPTASLVVHGDSDTVVNYQSGVYTTQCLSEQDTCDGTTTPAETSPCVTYNSCTSGKPLEWCLIPGLNHAPWTGAESEAWKFFNAAP